MPELSNENLSLWLKARDGLPCDEARALIVRLDALQSGAEVKRLRSRVEELTEKYESAATLLHATARSS